MGKLTINFHHDVTILIRFFNIDFHFIIFYHKPWMMHGYIATEIRLKVAGSHRINHLRFTGKAYTGRHIS